MAPTLSLANQGGKRSTLTLVTSKSSKLQTFQTVACMGDRFMDRFGRTAASPKRITCCKCPHRALPTISGSRMPLQSGRWAERGASHANMPCMRIGLGPIRGTRSIFLAFFFYSPREADSLPVPPAPRRLNTLLFLFRSISRRARASTCRWVAWLATRPSKSRRSRWSSGCCRCSGRPSSTGS